jgi:hypothetical protein
VHTAVEYRQYAQECMDSARSADSDDVRNQFLELAQLWLGAATQLDLRKSNGGTPRSTRPPVTGVDYEQGE